MKSESEGEGESRGEGATQQGSWAAALVAIGLDGYSITNRFELGQLGDLDLDVVARIKRRVAKGEIVNPDGYAVETLRREPERAVATATRETPVQSRRVFDPAMLDEDAQVVIEAVKAEMRGRVTKPSFDTWPSGVVGVRMEAETFVIGAPAEFIAQMVEERMFTLWPVLTSRGLGGWRRGTAGRSSSPRPSRSMRV